MGANVVKGCFDRAIDNLAVQRSKEETEAMIDSMVHQLRHTGISDEVKNRPSEHVRDDAGTAPVQSPIDTSMWSLGNDRNQRKVRKCDHSENLDIIANSFMNLHCLSG